MTADAKPTPESANAGRKQIKGRFRRGQSGNPAGKKPGTRHAMTMLAEQLMGNDVEGIVKKVVKEAKDGNMMAARLVLDRVAPIRRGRPIQINLPTVNTSADVMTAQGVLIKAVAAGELTPEEGQIVSDIIDAKRRTIETHDLEARIAALEKKEQAK